MDKAKAKENIANAFTKENIAKAVFIAFDTTFISIFTTEPDVVQYGITRMHIVLSFQIFNCLIEVFSGALRGMGHSALPAIMAIMGVCVFRLFYVFVIFSHFNTLEALFMIYPISWILTATAIVVSFIIIFRKKYRENMTVTAGNVKLTFNRVNMISPHIVRADDTKGADIVKVFPANVVGINYFKQLSGPYGKQNLMAVGGMNIDNIASYFSAGAKYVGIGSAMFNKDDIKNRNSNLMLERLERYVSIIEEVCK